jgi:hypothetical protein
MAHREPVEPVGAESSAGAVGVQDDLTGTAQRLVGDGAALLAASASRAASASSPTSAAMGQPVLADHHDVWSMPRSQQGVRPGVNADEHGTLLIG